MSRQSLKNTDMAFKRSMITQRSQLEDPTRLAEEGRRVKEIMMLSLGELNSPIPMRRLLTRRGSLTSAMSLSIMAKRRVRWERNLADLPNGKAMRIRTKPPASNREKTCSLKVNNQLIQQTTISVTTWAGRTPGFLPWTEESTTKPKENQPKTPPFPSWPNPTESTWVPLAFKSPCQVKNDY